MGQAVLYDDKMAAAEGTLPVNIHVADITHAGNLNPGKKGNDFSLYTLGG